MVPWAHPVLNPNGISIGSAVLAGLTSVTDRQPTDHATRSVTVDRVYVPHLRKFTYSTGDAV